MDKCDSLARDLTAIALNILNKRTDVTIQLHELLPFLCRIHTLRTHHGMH